MAPATPTISPRSKPQVFVPMTPNHGMSWARIRCVKNISGVPSNYLMIFDIDDIICLVVCFFEGKHSIASERPRLESGSSSGDDTSSQVTKQG